MADIHFLTTNIHLKDHLPAECNVQLAANVSFNSTQWFFERINNQLTLLGELDNTPFQLSFDLLSGSMKFRRERGGGRKEPLAKSIGLKHNAKPSIIDATAGMGREAFLLASLDCQVTGLERNPVIYALLQDAIDRLNQADKYRDIAARLEVHYTDSIDFLKTLDPSSRPEIVYMDPMFPERTKSAAVKKEMRIFKQLAGADPDDAALLDTARHTAQKKVVVKRPNHAPFVGDCKPSFQITSKKHRFDVYLS